MAPEKPRTGRHRGAENVWLEVQHKSRRWMVERTPVFTLRRNVRNFIVDVTDTKVHRHSDQGLGDTQTAVSKRDVMAVWDVLDRLGYASSVDVNVLYFTFALLQRAIPGVGFEAPPFRLVLRNRDEAMRLFDPAAPAGPPGAVVGAGKEGSRGGGGEGDIHKALKEKVKHDPVGTVGERLTYEDEDLTERLGSEVRFVTGDRVDLLMKDEQGRYVYFNRRFAETFGATAEAWLGRTDFDLRPEPLARELRESDQRVLREGRPVAVDVTVPDPAGREFYWLGMKFPFRDSAGRLLVGGVAVDVTERVRAEAGMREVSDRYQALFDSTFDAVIMHEAGVVLGMNRAACELFGYAQEEVLGRYAIDMVLPPESREWVLRQIRAGTESCYETVMWRKDGTTFPAEIRGRTIDYKGRPVRVASIRDLTARRAEEAARHAVEEQVAQSQRLEAVGRLAGGIAHEFNNLLTIIIGYCEPAAKEAVVARLPSGGELFEVVRAAERGAELAGQLLTFARKRPVQPEPFALDAMMERVKAMLARLLGEGIELVCPHESGLWPVLADAGQVEQVLVNLALNARDAMPQGGTLTIESDNADLTPDDPARPADLRPGRYVRLAVSDSGVGMSEEVRQHAFEPFFTTKGIGRGTGLGLSICYGIVRQNGWHISLRSGAEAGTTFTIYLPAAASDAPPQPAPPPPAEDAPRAARGQTVLLAEDETLIRVVAARALRARGYQVIEAGDGQDALEQAKKHAGPLHALVTDVGMPRIGGIELARRLREDAPGLPVLFCTGYGEEAVQGERVVRKPFRPADLAAAVDALLDGPRAASNA
jgi:PAS domain S-box-containing protein